mgnify:CR=1 FL=1
MNTTRQKVIWLLEHAEMTIFQLSQSCGSSVSRVKYVLGCIGASVVSQQKGTGGRPWNVYTLR